MFLHAFDILRYNIVKKVLGGNMLEVYIDGASSGNPGPSGIGLFIKGEGHSIQIGEFIGESNNHVAEFIALIRGLEEAKKLGTSFVSVRSDSKIVVSSMEKKYVKNEQFKPYLEEALKLADEFDLFFIKWIPEQQNKAADLLARQAIRKGM
jgi:ribonuclease HI